MKNILIISPHPDDESIGCGGTILKHIEEGDIVEVIFLTSGEKGGHKIKPEETKIIREKEANEAANILGIRNIEFWREPDGELQVSETNIDRLLAKINSYKPNLVYVTHEAEKHPDHLAAYKLVETTRKKILSKNQMLNVRMYEVWTPIQKMDVIIDISPFIEIKKKAILAHKSQCDVLQFDEAIIGLNRYRGEMHLWPGGDYAEVFMEMR